MTKLKKLPSDKQYEDEAQLLKKAKEWLEPQRRDGILLIRICDRYTRGYSDLFICVQGVLVVAELKDNTGVASQQQLDFIEDVIDCGGIGGVCRSVRDISYLIEQAKERVNEQRLRYADSETLRSGLQPAT